MADLHKLVISSPDGVGYKTRVTIDGQEVHPVSITLHASGSGAVRAVVEFDPASVEFDGMAEVKVMR